MFIARFFPSVPVLARQAGRFAAVVGLLAALGMAPIARSDVSGQIRVPEQALAIMGLDQVRVGMTGYGLTVLQGNTITSFPVEVITLERGVNPGRATIWVICDDPRLEHSGAIQGMSGSPIFLWDSDEPQVLGEGGRLIGAFAYGYRSVVDQCLAGVQPIEQMRGVLERMQKQQEEKDDPVFARDHRTRDRLALMDRLGVAMGQPASGAAPWQMRQQTYLRDLVRGGSGQAAMAWDLPPQTQTSTFSAAGQTSGKPQAMMMPLALPTLEMATFFEPLLQASGIVPVAGGLIAGTPPPNIDPQQTFIEPGSVITIPLAYGDMDLSASGTVTEVLPDGSVLGLGHAMFGQGRTKVPMATGYVHYVVPSRIISFKRAGSLQIQGSLHRDEMTAVAGSPERTFQTAPASVRVRVPDQPDRAYAYHVVDHPDLTGTLAAIVTLSSIVAEQSMPPENTATVRYHFEFEQGYTLSWSRVMSPSNERQIALDFLSILTFLRNNPFEPIRLKRMAVDVEVIAETRVTTLVSAWLDHAQVAPGQRLRAYVQLQDMQGPRRIVPMDLEIPEHVAEGDYLLAIGGASTQLAALLQSRPFLTDVTSIPDVFDALEVITAVDTQELFAGLLIPDRGLAIGRATLGDLPSSRAAMLTTPASSRIVPIQKLLTSRIPMDRVVEGQQVLQVSIRQPYTHMATPRNAAP